MDEQTILENPMSSHKKSCLEPLYLMIIATTISSRSRSFLDHPDRNPQSSRHTNDQKIIDAMSTRHFHTMIISTIKMFIENLYVVCTRALHELSNEVHTFFKLHITASEKLPPHQGLCEIKGTVSA